MMLVPQMEEMEPAVQGVPTAGPWHVPPPPLVQLPETHGPATQSQSTLQGAPVGWAFGAQ